MANAGERLRTIDPGGQLQDERWRTLANAGGRCARELQNRWSASLAMSTDGSFPSRPRQFEFETDATAVALCSETLATLRLSMRSDSNRDSNRNHGLQIRRQFELSPPRGPLKCSRWYRLGHHEEAQPRMLRSLACDWITVVRRPVGFAPMAGYTQVVRIRTHAILAGPGDALAQLIVTTTLPRARPSPT